MLDVVGKAFQGLTVARARCHDHKFNPIPTADCETFHEFAKRIAYWFVAPSLNSS